MNRLKKEYEEPIVDIEVFSINSKMLITTSSLDEGDDEDEF